VLKEEVATSVKLNRESLRRKEAESLSSARYFTANDLLMTKGKTSTVKNVSHKRSSVDLADSHLVFLCLFLNCLGLHPAFMCFMHSFLWISLFLCCTFVVLGLVSSARKPTDWEDWKNVSEMTYSVSGAT